jgi:glycerol-3-phosphate dehydrogenase
LLVESDMVVGASVRDDLSGEALPVRARVVVNAAGPWVDEVRLLYGHGEQPRLHPSKGIHVVLPHERIPVSRIVVMTTPDKRSVFVVPHGDTVYLGTTDTDYEGSLDEPPISLDDVRYLLDSATATFAVAPVRVAEVVGAWAGLRPLLHEAGKKPTELSRKDEIMVSAGGLISMAGGKLTTFRKMAERTVDMVAARLSEAGRPVPPKRGDSERALLCGGDTGDDIAAYTDRLRTRWLTVSHDIVEHLVSLYGNDAETILGAIASEPVLGARCGPESPITHAEVAYALRSEMVMSMDDFLERRSRVMLYGRDNGLAIAPAVAEAIGAALAWNSAQIVDALARYRARVAAVKSFQLESDAPRQAAHA